MTDLRKQAEDSIVREVAAEDGNKHLPMDIYARKYGLDAGQVFRRIKNMVIDKDGRIAESVPHIRLAMSPPDWDIEITIEDIDCKWYDVGCCSKGLPGTFCEREGCVAYYPKGNADNAQKDANNK